MERVRGREKLDGRVRTERVRRDLDMSEKMGKVCFLETAVLRCGVHLGVR